jgi:hypothetical protein
MVPRVWQVMKQTQARIYRGARDEEGHLRLLSTGAQAEAA